MIAKARTLNRKHCRRKEIAGVHDLKGRRLGIDRLNPICSHKPPSPASDRSCGIFNTFSSESQDSGSEQLP